MIYVSQFISLLCLIFWVKGDELYSVSAKNGTPCLSDTNCHDLSYFTEHPSLYFSDNTVFYFLEGRHVLNDTIEINGVSNLTLKGLGTMEQGFHYTVLQSTVEISCEGAVSAGLVFINVSNVSISDLLITRCSGPSLRNTHEEFSKHLLAIGTVILEAENQSSSILILQSVDFLMSGVSVVNTTGYGLTAINLLNSTITHSSFAANNFMKLCQSPNSQCKGGNTFIAFTYHWPDVCANLRGVFLKIEYSNFTFGFIDANPKTGSLSFGGGLTVLLDQGNKYQSDISVFRVIALNNTASSSGNIQFFVSRRTTTFKLECNFVNSLFGNIISHRRKTRGGGMLVRLGISSHLVSFNCNTSMPVRKGIVAVVNSEFSYNVAHFGGGVFISNLIAVPVVIILQSCTFSYNEGLGGVGLSIIQNSQKAFNRYYIYNVTVSSSVYRGYTSIVQELSSSVSLFFASIININNLNVSSNSPCYGMYVHYSIITFYGSNTTFFNNTSYGNGGAIHLSTLSRIQLTRNVYLTFSNNHASRRGGALFVDTSSFLVPFCFLVLFDNPDTLGMIFINNSAMIQGDGIFIDSCSRLQVDENAHRNVIFNVLNFDGQPKSITNAFSSVPYQIHHCQDDNDTEVKQLAVYPGESITLQFITKGVFGAKSPGLIQVNQIIKSKVKFLVLDTTNLGKLSLPCKSLRVNIRATKETKNLIIVAFANQMQITKTGLSTINRIVFNTSILTCPRGFMLHGRVCQCNQLLIQIVPTVVCRIDGRVITTIGNEWLGFENSSNSLLLTTNCPYDYCVDGSVSFNESTPDNQCRMNRSGIMCGQCSEGLSLMLGSNQCGVCTNSSLYLLVVFGVAGIVLVLFLVVLNLTVSVGTINGLIFYTNVIKINEHAFLSNSSLPVLSQFISWFNLDLGINTCFISNLDAVTKLALQFVFPAYIWILIGIVIIICKYSQRLSNYIGHNAVPVFATLILLSYTKVLRTLVPILKFERITILSENSSLSQQLYWASDGNVPSSSTYIALASCGVFTVLLFAAPYTILLLLQPLMLSRFKKPHFQRLCLNLKPLFDAYYGPYKQKFQVWTGVLLCVRLVLVIVASFASGELYLSLSNALGIFLLLIICYFGGVYERKLTSFLECWSMLNIAVLSAVVRAVPYAGLISISVMLCTFIAIILYHCSILKLLKKIIFKRFIIKKTVDKEESVDFTSLSQRSITSTDIRESLLLN